MRYLLVVTHPDDEVLGADASIQKWAKKNNTVDIVIICTEVGVRALRPGDGELNSDLDESVKYLGTNEKYEAIFPNIEVNTVPHLKLVQFTESAIKESEPGIIITRHPVDINNNHLQASMACQEAIRLFQRRSEIKRVREFWYMEVPSYSEWAINGAMNLSRPNCYAEVGKEGIDVRIKTLSMYRGVMRPYPHPRPAEYICGLVLIRGSQWGVNYAEAFEMALRTY